MLYGFAKEIFLAKIAVESERQASGHPTVRVLARGDGWTVSDVVCSAGPHDRPFEEQHLAVCIAIVVEGSFQYRSSGGRELMTPGSLLLGNAGQYFECGHEHGKGDRCIAFAYEPQYFERLAVEAGMQSRHARFSPIRVPPVRELSRLVARACAGLAEFNGRPSLEHAGISNSAVTTWEEIGMNLAARTLEIANGGMPNRVSFPAAEARVTRIVRMIESDPGLDHGISSLAREARLSRFHFLRIFKQVTGLTPHRYICRTRLRRAATQLLLEPARVLDIALDSGFGDVSNFNRAFRAEFGVNPSAYRRRHR